MARVSVYLNQVCILEGVTFRTVDYDKSKVKVVAEGYEGEEWMPISTWKNKKFASRLLKTFKKVGEAEKNFAKPVNNLSVRVQEVPEERVEIRQPQASQSSPAECSPDATPTKSKRPVPELIGYIIENFSEDKSVQLMLARAKQQKSEIVAFHKEAISNKQLLLSLDKINGTYVKRKQLGLTLRAYVDLVVGIQLDNTTSRLHGDLYQWYQMKEEAKWISKKEYRKVCYNNEY